MTFSFNATLTQLRPRRPTILENHLSIKRRFTKCVCPSSLLFLIVIPTILEKSPWDSTAIFNFFLSFLGFLLKQCILFKIFLQFSLPPHYTKLKLGKKTLDTRVQHCLWGEGRGWTCVNWKTPQKRKSVPRLLSMIVASLVSFF